MSVKACVVVLLQVKCAAADSLYLSAFRKLLSVSVIIILIILTHSVIDLIQLVYCLNKLYCS